MATEPFGCVTLDEIGLVTASGERVTLADFVDRPTVVVLVRYFG